MPATPRNPAWKMPFPIRDTLREMSEKTGIPFSTLQTQITGKAKIGLVTVMSLSHAYQIPMEELVIHGESVAIRPQDRGRARNGRTPMSATTQPWDLTHVDARHPGMKLGADTDAQWTRAQSQTSLDPTEHGLPAVGTLDWLWWQYRALAAAGSYTRAGMMRADAELFHTGHTDRDELAYVHVLNRRAEDVTAALEAGRTITPWSPADAAAALAKRVRKLRKK